MFKSHCRLQESYDERGVVQKRNERPLKIETQVLKDNSNKKILEVGIRAAATPATESRWYWRRVRIKSAKIHR